MYLSNKNNILEKAVVTYCKDRGENKCPPWEMRSKKVKHDLVKKTIYYDNVVLKIYNLPIFFSPKFSHPDPTVNRKSGFLTPSLISSSNLGSGTKIPFFWDLGNDKDLTLTPRIYLNENPILLGEYRQD
jgi:LPS-assembly protein